MLALSVSVSAAPPTLSGATSARREPGSVTFARAFVGYGSGNDFQGHGDQLYSRLHSIKAMPARGSPAAQLTREAGRGPNGIRASTAPCSVRRSVMSRQVNWGTRLAADAAGSE